METIQNKHGSTQRSKFDYTYDPVGTIHTWTQQADSSTAVVNTLAYDNADQLTGNVQTGGATAGNQYHDDPAGNRLAEVTLSGTTVTGTTAGLFNTLNQLTTLSGTSAGSTTVTGTTSLGASSVIVNGVAATLTGSTSFSATVPTLSGTNIFAITARTIAGAPVTQLFQATVSGSVTATALAYDLNGNTTTDENGNTYTWDALNRLTRITYPSTAYTTMAYDGLSRRTQIAEYDSSHALTSTKNYLWIGSEIAEERDASNVVTKRFFPQGEQQSGTNYYYATDHLGSVREVLNSSGAIVARYAYDPNGVTTLVSGTDMATFGWAAMYRHIPSQSYQTRFRIYRPDVALWDTRDPIGENGGTNLYGYVLNDPIDYTDPMGLKVGQCYCTAHDAAVAALQEINLKSQNEHSEYATRVYLDGKDAKGNDCWKYLDFTTLHLPNNSWVPPAPPNTQKGPRVHTHPPDPLFHSGQYFSTPDTDNAKADHVLSYIATPDGRIKVYDPATPDKETYTGDTAPHLPPQRTK